MLGAVYTAEHEPASGTLRRFILPETSSFFELLQVNSSIFSYLGHSLATLQPLLHPSGGVSGRDDAAIC